MLGTRLNLIDSLRRLTRVVVSVSRRIYISSRSREADVLVWSRFQPFTSHAQDKFLNILCRSR